MVRCLAWIGSGIKSAGMKMHETLPNITFDQRGIAPGAGPGASLLSVADWSEVGIEVTEGDSFRPHFCMVINRDQENIRIPYDSPVFKAVLDYFASIGGFDWQPLVNARFSGEPRYFPCWRRETTSRNGTVW